MQVKDKKNGYIRECCDPSQDFAVKGKTRVGKMRETTLRSPGTLTCFCTHCGQAWENGKCKQGGVWKRVGKDVRNKPKS